MKLADSIRADYCRYILDFKFTAITSRQSMSQKETWFLRLTDLQTGKTGFGECALFRGLSADDTPDYDARLRHLCECINRGEELPPQTSSISFGLETAVNDLYNGGKRIIWQSGWTDGKYGIRTNGLIWMGSQEEMSVRIAQKLDEGFKCLKLKIGGIDFEQELKLLEHIRSRFDATALELRLDANGSFSPKDALSKLERLSRYDIHSIEQPIRAGQWFAMASICRKSPIPIALDEELIGDSDDMRRESMFNIIQPSYIILKPSLCGGMKATERWIETAKAHKTGWWLTSALESNIGLNAIAQLAAKHNVKRPQGLGTGLLYHNNIPSPLILRGERLYYDTTSAAWNLEGIDFSNK